MSALATIVEQPSAVVVPQAQSETAAILSMIERAARDPQTDLEKMERLMVMADDMRSKAAKRAFSAALSVAKASIGPIAKKRTVDFTSAKGRTNYKFEDLALVAEVVDPVLSQHGLSYRYRSKQEQGRLHVGCVVSHQDGHEEETWLSAPNDDSGNKNSIQAVASTATYLQRYTLKLALGLSAGPDTDGETPALPSVPVSEDQAAKLREWIEATQSDETIFLAHFKAQSVAAFPAAKFDAAVALFKKKARK